MHGRQRPDAGIVLLYSSYYHPFGLGGQLMQSKTTASISIAVLHVVSFTPQILRMLDSRHKGMKLPKHHSLQRC